MKMDVEQPPWANELLARNRKVGRTICSTSDINQGKTSFSFEIPKSNSKGYDDSDRSGQGRKQTEDNKVTDPSSPSQVRSTTRRLLLQAGSSIHDDVFCDPLSCEDKDMRESLWNLSHTSSGEDSILEYGPGIVSKLRSKYQSLAARQPPVRPSLNRSTSLEHSLDFVHLEHLAFPKKEVEGESVPTSPHTLPQVSTEHKDGSKVAKPGMMTLNIRPSPTTSYNKIVTNTNALHILPRNRGSTAGNIEQQNRMRRARSVDSLQHNHIEYTRQEEEILKKLKNVVLPKEEVVIIEMSKPRLNLGNLQENEFVNLKYNAINTLISPEHELPPHFIVRDTARKFETNPGGHQWKKVGHVLKDYKSPSVSPTSSARSSPSCLSPIPVITSAEKKVQVVSAQPQQRQSKLVENSSPKIMSNFHSNSKGTEAITTGIGRNIQSNSPGKQVGIIRPTVNGVQKTSSASLSKPLLTKPRRETSSPSNNRVFQFIQPPAKPPLGPKPIVLSKPEEQAREKVPKISTLDEFNKKLVEMSTLSTNCVTEIQHPGDLKLDLTIRMDSNDSPPTSHSPVSSNTIEPNVIDTMSSDIVAVKPLEKFTLKLKPVVGTTIQKSRDGLQKQGSNKNNLVNANEHGQSIAFASQNAIRSQKQPYNDTATSSSANVAGSHINSYQFSKRNDREGDALKNSKALVEDPKENVSDDKSSPAVSKLRSHQKQKSQQSGGSIVFNFTNRVKVPDYIEDDGLHLSRGKGNTLDELADDSVDGNERIDSKFIQFIGANVIINGKSSIQKKPKSQKMSIRFNEEGTTTFEYPSEASALSDVESQTSDTSGPNNNVVTENSSSGVFKNLSGGIGLSNYTPSKVVSNNYQLGFYRENVMTDATSNTNSSLKKMEDEIGDGIEDYLKPDTGSTTWSNEIGAADILF